MCNKIFLFFNYYEYTRIFLFCFVVNCWQSAFCVSIPLLFLPSFLSCMHFAVYFFWCVILCLHVCWFFFYCHLFLVCHLILNFPVLLFVVFFLHFICGCCFLAWWMMCLFHFCLLLSLLSLPIVCWIFVVVCLVDMSAIVIACSLTCFLCVSFPRFLFVGSSFIVLCLLFIFFVFFSFLLLVCGIFFCFLFVVTVFAVLDNVFVIFVVVVVVVVVCLWYSGWCICHDFASNIWPTIFWRNKLLIIYFSPAGTTLIFIYFEEINY